VDSPGGVRLDSGGWFEVATAQPDVLLAEVLDWPSAAKLERRVHRYAESGADGSWDVLLDVGWLALLELGDAEVEPTSVALLEEIGTTETRWPMSTLANQVGSVVTVLFQQAAFEPDASHRVGSRSRRAAARSGCARGARFRAERRAALSDRRRARAHRVGRRPRGRRARRSLARSHGRAAPARGHDPDRRGQPFGRDRRERRLRAGRPRARGCTA
jgi:hypothetical protein